MAFIILDLEWNGTYSKKTRKYFNEIIEIGAVKVSRSLEPVDTFHTVIRPVVSRRLSSVVRSLTGIEKEELKEGRPFAQAVSQLRRWIGDPSAIVMTWSTTDLLVLLENCRYFLNQDRIPFIKNYADLQAYFHFKLGLSGSQQTGLVKACEMLGISDNRQDKHRALDDSVLSGQVFARIYDSEAFSRFVFCADEEFYRRLTYKTTIISDLKNEYVNLAKLKFKCCDCGNPVERVGEWCFRSRAFFADYYCAECDKKYTARVQVKLKYSGAETAKTLTQKPEPPPEEPGVSGDGQ